MRVVYKYALKSTEDQIVELPVGAEILNIKLQNSTWQLWALIDPAVKALKDRRIIIAGTGNHFNVPGLIMYINTYMTPSEQYVFHFFEAEIGEN